MSTANLFWAVTGIMGTVIAGFAAVGKLLWNVSAKWTKAASNIEKMSENIRDLVQSKEREHVRLETRIDRVEQRIERHESWHSDHYSQRG